MSEISSQNSYQSEISNISLTEGEHEQNYKEKEKEKDFIPTEFELKIYRKYAKFMVYFYIQYNIQLKTNIKIINLFIIIFNSKFSFLMKNHWKINK